MLVRHRIYRIRALVGDYPPPPLFLQLDFARPGSQGLSRAENIFEQLFPLSYGVRQDHVDVSSRCAGRSSFREPLDAPNITCLHCVFVRMAGPCGSWVIPGQTGMEQTSSSL